MEVHESDVLIVGTGAAGHPAARTLRAEGFDGTVTVVHGEPGRPYNRTLVDKGILPGLLTAEQAALPHLTEVTMRHGRAAALDPALRTVTLDDGSQIGYRALLIAAGSSPNAGPAHGPALSMHDASDAERARLRIGATPTQRTVVILGAGFIGAEVASFFASAGARVHLVSRSHTPLVGALGVPIASRLRDLHAERTALHANRTATSVEPHEAGVRVRLDDGTSIDADLVIRAHGTVPNTGWVTGARAGLRVNSRLRVSGFEVVYAAGSVAVYTDAADRTYRVDHWDAATAQGVHAARAILHDLAGHPDPGAYRATTGYTLNVHGAAITGIGRAGARVETRTTGASGLLTTFHGEDGRLTGAVGWAAGRDVHALREELGTR